MTVVDKFTHNRHIQAGLIAGKDATCGKKIDYKSETTANKAANRMNTKATTNHLLEAYPCVFCDGWHIGRVFNEN